MEPCDRSSYLQLRIPDTSNTRRCNLLPAPDPVEPLTVDLYHLTKDSNSTWGWNHSIHHTITQTDGRGNHLHLRLSDLGRGLPAAVPVSVPVQRPSRQSGSSDEQPARWRQDRVKHEKAWAKISDETISLSPRSLTQWLQTLRRC